MLYSMIPGIGQFYNEQKVQKLYILGHLSNVVFLLNDHLWATKCNNRIVTLGRFQLKSSFFLDEGGTLTINYLLLIFAFNALISMMPEQVAIRMETSS